MMRFAIPCHFQYRDIELDCGTTSPRRAASVNRYRRNGGCRIADRALVAAHHAERRLPCADALRLVQIR